MYEIQYRVFGNDEPAVVQKSESIMELEETLEKVRKIVRAASGFRVEEDPDNFKVTILVQVGSGWDEVSSYRIAPVTD